MNLNNTTYCHNMKSSCADISHPAQEKIRISYVVGKLSFIDTPKIYEQGSNVVGKVSECGLHFFSMILC